MTEIKKVKVQSIIESQIPEFLNEESPLFAEFLKQYYTSQEFETGSITLSRNIPEYKNIDFFNEENFYTEKNPCTLTSDIFSFSDSIEVNDTFGFPDSYGLLKIDDEIITYISKTETLFLGCIRGFSGISKNDDDDTLNFSATESKDHVSGSNVKNLSLDYFNVLFQKFKSQFLPGFEERTLSEKTKIKNVLLEARDFYTTKGTDISFKLLFSILFSKPVEVITPKDYTLSPSSNEYVVTKNILVEQVIRNTETKSLSTNDLSSLKGKTLFQNVFGNNSENISSASIFNIEYRPFDDIDLFEISLDSTSFLLNFQSTQKTKTIERININSNQILVDSTVGFKPSGNLLVKTENFNYPIKISYTDKTINQFLGVSGITDTIGYNSNVTEENFLYTFLDDGTIIEFRLLNLIDTIDFEKSSNLRVGDKVSLSKFGIDLSDNINLNKWIYNISTNQEISSITNDGTSLIIRLLNQDIKIEKEERIRLINSNDNSFIITTVLNYSEDSNGKYIRIPLIPNFNQYNILRKEIRKAESNNNYFSEIITQPTGIQNSYVDYDLNYFYIASTGLPNYTIFSTDNKKFVNISIANTDTINSTNHGYYTGEKVYYFNRSNSGISTGAYYVERIDQNNIKLSFSKNDLLLKEYITFENQIPINTDYFIKFGLQELNNEKEKTLKNQKLFKKFPLKQNLNRKSIDRTVNDRTLGMFLNGVELNSYTLFDENVYYGKIDSIIVDTKGNNYDVINFSGLEVSDVDKNGIPLGIGCSVHANLSGNLKEVIIISPGVGYQFKPKITLTGGNGSGAILESNLVKTKISSRFNGNLTGLNFNNNSITFLENHNFENAEEVIYKTNGNNAIPPFVNNSSYFVGIVSEKTIKVYSNKNDVFVGLNTITLAGISTGIHSFETLNSKNTITKIYVKESGEGYSNRLVKVPSKVSVDNKTNGINFYENYIFAKNHGFKNRDIIDYSTTTYPISGLSTETQYIATIIDQNKFKLSEVGVDTGKFYSNYENKKFVNIAGIGTGLHTFSYPPIELKIESLLSIGTTVPQNPILKPIVLGSIDDVFIVDGGGNYGTPEILNFHRKPFVGISSITSQSILKPVISNGSIISVQILNKGKGYKNDTLIKIYGSGKYAQLEPVIEDGRIVDIKVLNQGKGYDEKTSLIVERYGNGAKFIGNVFEWKINQVEKNKLNNINPIDESYLISSKDDSLGLKLINFYPTKKLRYLLDDNILENNQEVPSGSSNRKVFNIVGWAYDGNPIFGPYALFGSEIRRVRSSYRLITSNEKNDLESKNLRPANPLFTPGFFVQDYIYDKKVTDGDLDEFNGMFINEKDLPGINYGYFYTIDENVVSSPVFPYVVGKQFKDLPFYENFEPSFNQDTDISKLNLVRNVGSYYLNSKGSSYDPINKVDEKYKQDFIVTEINSSGINSIRIYNKGEDYKVGDYLVFDNTNTGGSGISAEISQLFGKNIISFNVGISTVKNVKFVSNEYGIRGISSSPHGFLNNQSIIISGISSNNYSFLNDSYKILVNSKKVSLLENLLPTSTTGNWTSIKVSDISGFKVNDFIGIGTEILRITNISSEESKLFVNRFSSISTTYYSGISSVVLLPNDFILNTSEKIDVSENKTTYFNPSNSIGIGTSGTTYYKNIDILTTTGILDGANNDTRKYIGVTTAGLLSVGDLVYGNFITAGTQVISVGIGSVEISPITTFSGVSTSVSINFKRQTYDKFIPAKSIYIKNHNFFTGQELIYGIGVAGTGIYTENNLLTYQLLDGQTVYAVNLGTDYVGISTLGFTTTSGIGTDFKSVFFVSPNTTIGYSHSLTTKYPEIDGRVESYFGNITTNESHGLLDDDLVRINFIPNITKNITIRYDSELRKITTDLLSFSTNIGVNTSTSEITIFNDDLDTGDKVVYYNNGNSPVGGLQSNFVYYVYKNNPDTIKLCETKYDALNGNSIGFSSTGIGTHFIALLSPKINAPKGSTLTFNLDQTLYSNDGSLNFDFKFYKDSKFELELEKFKYNVVGSTVSLNTLSNDYQKELFYNLVPIDKSVDSSFTILDYDDEVLGSNKIQINDSLLNNTYPIVSTSTTSYQISFNQKLENNNYSIESGINSVFYETTSKNSFGSISKVKINYGGIGYFKLPKVVSVATTSGKNSLLKCESNTIGKISKIERVKDGFDYPSDHTLSPYLSVPAVVQIKDISRIGSVGIITGGNGYTRPPSLVVIGNSQIKLSAKIDGGSVNDVEIIENVNNLSVPLTIIPTRNSNGHEIDFIEVNGTEVTLELINNDVQIYPLINTGFGSIEVVFPFKVGDEIFVENCRQLEIGQTDSFNSKDYNYSFFKITSVDENNYKISYDMSSTKNDFIGNLLTGESNYNTNFGYGFVVNKNKIAQFEMLLSDDLSYISGERVYSDDFNAVVMDNGWDNDINQLRLDFSSGELQQNDKLKGEVSLLNGTIESFNIFNLKSNLGLSREKINQVGKQSGILNDYQHRISDNNYYQKFSYSLKGEIPYVDWKEPVLSLIHPSGFKEFSDLDILSKPSNSLNVNLDSSGVNLLVNIDNKISLSSKENFTLVTEDSDNYFEGSIERFIIGAEEANVSGIGLTGPIFGIPLKPYTLNKTNKILDIDDISSQFNGSNNFEKIDERVILFNSFEPNYVGISTVNIQIGDYIGLSTYLDLENTFITQVGINSARINIPHKLIVGTASSITSVKRRLPGNSIVGIQSFKLKSEGIPLFYREFDSSNGITTNINLNNNTFILNNHHLQSGQRIYYSDNGGTRIGIATTSSVEANVDIIIEVGGAGGGSIYENGYNVAISTAISGTAINIPGASSRYYGFGNPIPSYSITGVGTGAKFEIFITYDPGSGSPLSTSIILKQGGGQYVIGNQVGISGTYLGGSYPANNLTFTISKLSSSRIAGQSNQSYSNVSSTLVSGTGSNATFNVFRDSLGDISSVTVVNGGIGYTSSSSLKINGSSVGGSNGVDDLFLSPTVLGTDVLPETLYVEKVNDNVFKVLGTPSSDELDLNTLGVGTHSFTYDNPNANSLIVIDGIIQSPLSIRNVTTILSQPIGVGSTNIYLSVGINSISSLDYLKINNEYLKVNSVGVGSTNIVEVSRGFFGSTIENHSVGSAITVTRGDYNIIKDNIYFSTPPYGKIGPSGLEINSSFAGKIFSRSFDYLNNPDDKNIILDDISVEFTGDSQNIGIKTATLDSSNKLRLSGINTSSLSIGDVINLEYSNPFLLKQNTIIESIGSNFVNINQNHNVNVGIATTTLLVTRLNFVLKSNKQNVVGLFTDTNGSGTDISNNPIILVSNVPQNPGVDFVIDTPGNNTIKFISGIPNAGNIVNVSLTTSFGYSPLIAASGNVSVSSAGTILNVVLTNFGSGYRNAPNVSLMSSVGVGATFSTTIGLGGTVSGITIINPGTGYSTSNRLFKIVGVNTNISIGSTIIYIPETSNITIGSSLSIVGTAITNVSIVSVGETTVTIGYANTINSIIPNGSFARFSTFDEPKLIIEEPKQYYDMPLQYASGYSGSGKNAKISVTIGNGSSITSYQISNPGIGYKVGDVLTISGIVTSTSLTQIPVRITIVEELTDKFSGFFPGQFVKLNDISSFFNGFRRRFTLSLTRFGVSSPLSLKVDPGVKLNLQNNLFVYLNDIFQKPFESYTFSGSRITFTEPPRPNSKCLIMYYRGSSLDVEDIIPPETLKEGDTVQIKENINIDNDISQFERVVKKILSSDQVDTLSYDSIGINTNSFISRPLTWTKQNEDTIINGVFYSKSRGSLKSRNIPTTKIIKNISPQDTQIYVSNAFPLFSIDENLGIEEDLRNVFIVENKQLIEPKFKSIVSSGSSISQIQILNGGLGYTEILSPSIKISSSYIQKRDPILDWKSTAGINSNFHTFNSIIYGDRFVLVGSEGKYALSDDGINWQLKSTGYNINLNSIVYIDNQNYIAVGATGTMLKKVSIASTLTSWEPFPLVKRTTVFGFQEEQTSQYDGTFRDLTYSSEKATIVAVGDFSAGIGYCPIFSAVGIGSTQFIERATTNTNSFNAVTNNNQFFVAVGNNGAIRYSLDAITWTIVGDSSKPQGITKLNDIIWDGSRFIAVGNGGIVINANNPDFWLNSNSNITENILKINHNDGLYVGITSLGNMYYSLNLSDWYLRNTSQANAIKDIVFVPSVGSYGRSVIVGSSSTVIYSDPVFNRASAVTTTSNSIINSVTVTNGGFGYTQQKEPPVIAELDFYNYEELKSVKVIGDFGIITGINTSGIGNSEVKFELKSEYYDNSNLGIGYSSLNTFGVMNSQLSIGDRFIIFDSNINPSSSITGITTFGGLTEVVGVSTNYLDGIYSVEVVTIPDQVTGIVTVTCRFSSNPQIFVSSATTSFYGRYSWGKIFGYQNRARGNPKAFNINPTNGLTGLTTSPDIFRIRPLV